jgi:hypothetical protein
MAPHSVDTIKYTVFLKKFNALKPDPPFFREFTRCLMNAGAPCAIFLDTSGQWCEDISFNVADGDGIIEKYMGKPVRRLLWLRG